jgi:transposase InsO family protein
LRRTWVLQAIGVAASRCFRPSIRETLKEEVYWRLDDHPRQARECLAEFRERYNRRRPHWALRPEGGGDPLAPEEVYAGGRRVQTPKWQAWALAAKARLDELLVA